jgi:uncharacterized protein YjbI with pentapeptide repeats
MHKALMRSASLKGLTLVNVTLDQADLRDIKADYVYMDGVNLSGSDLRRADLTLMILEDVDLRGANLEEIKYGRSTLQFLAASRLEGAKMSKDLQKDLEDFRTGM